LYWNPDKTGDPRQRYREIDAPLTRYLLGLGRRIAGYDSQPVDWDWTASWNANVGAGAYPEPGLIQTARFTITLLLPVSLGIIYLIGKRLKGSLAGILAMLLLGTNAVVLLHGRRAMAEGVLLFGILLATWSILKAQESPWLAGLGLGLAFNAKHSALALLPVAVFALVWIPGSKTRHLEKAVLNMVQFSLAFVIIIFTLNPVLWRYPVRAVRSAIDARTLLAEQQAMDSLRIETDKESVSTFQQVSVLLINLAISPPEYGLVENLSPTLDEVEAYIAIPGHNLFRGIVGGGIILVLLFFGLAVAIRSSFRVHTPHKRDLIILLLATLSMVGGLLVAVQIYWIRYTIPAIPFVCIWIAYGLASIFEKQSPG
jgi:4-amino-4-deoxy-L-arabinose transferase-like glycosyltransferase